ncbi:MAG TPA: hypothetical protein PKM23_11800 [bacterium]|nr:hypothetical protein [bacterium]
MRNLIFVAVPLLLSCAHSIDPASLRLASRQGIEITRSDRLTTPATVKGALADLGKVKKDKRAETLLLFLKENSDTFKIQAPELELKLLRSDEDELGFTHYRYARLIREVPVYGDELILHVNNKSQLYMVNGQYHPTQLPESKPALTAEKAGAIALAKGLAHRMESIEQTTLVYYPASEELRLAWHVILRGGLAKWDYFIDAADGRILFDQDRKRS